MLAARLPLLRGARPLAPRRLTTMAPDAPIWFGPFEVTKQVSACVRGLLPLGEGCGL